MLPYTPFDKTVIGAKTTAKRLCANAALGKKGGAVAVLAILTQNAVVCDQLIANKALTDSEIMK